MRAKTVNENIKFKRGIDPKHSMDIGEITLPHRQIERAVREVADSNRRVSDTDIEIYEKDPKNFSMGFHYRNATIWIEVNPTYDKQFVVGMGDDAFPSGEQEEYDTIEEAKERLSDWMDIIDENIEDQDHYCEECGEELDDPDYPCPYCEDEDED